jgi:transposase
MVILELRQQGLSVSAIAERSGQVRKTVRQVIEWAAPRLAVRHGARREPLPVRQYAMRQDLGTTLRCHMLAFEHFGGTPHEIGYDRMKTAVLGEAADDTGIACDAKLIGLSAHEAFKPRACKPSRAKTKGKIERPFRRVRANCALARRFANFDDLNRQRHARLDTAADARLHGSAGRIVDEHFAADCVSLKLLPAGRFDAMLRTVRRVSHEGLVSVGGNLYSVPDDTVEGVLELETTADCVRIYDGHRLMAVHALLPGHRQARRSNTAPEVEKPLRLQPPGHGVARKGREVYAAIAERASTPNRCDLSPLSWELSAPKRNSPAEAGLCGLNVSRSGLSARRERPRSLRAKRRLRGRHCRECALQLLRSRLLRHLLRSGLFRRSLLRGSLLRRGLFRGLLGSGLLCRRLLLGRLLRSGLLRRSLLRSGLLRRSLLRSGLLRRSLLCSGLLCRSLLRSSLLCRSLLRSGLLRRSLLRSCHFVSP